MPVPQISKANSAIAEFIIGTEYIDGSKNIQLNAAGIHLNIKLKYTILFPFISFIDPLNILKIPMSGRITKIYCDNANNVRQYKNKAIPPKKHNPESNNVIAGGILIILNI